MIDLHAHYLSPRALEAARVARPGGVEYDAEQRVVVFASGPSRPVPPPLANLATFTARSASLQLQVLSPWMDVTGDDLPGTQAAEWCRVLNDATAEDLASVDGIEAFAALPVSSGEEAARELQRTFAHHGFVGGALPTQVAGVDLDEAGLDPLFEAAQDLGLPLFLHPYRVPEPSRLGRFFLTNVCGAPFDTTVAALRLFFSGMLDRWPEVRILLAHCGGALPMLAGRAAHASGSVPHIDRVLESPDEVLGRFYYDTVLHDPHALAFGATRVGLDRLVAGSDTPFPMLIENLDAHLRHALTLAGFADDAVTTVSEETPRRLLGR